MSPERLDALFAPLAGAAGWLLAVSGGPDSVALLSLAARWREGRVAPALHAATVDHGLRPEAADEAHAVAALCSRLSIPHRTLVWEGDKPTTRLQERAREARYRLLAGHARAVGADVLVVAHHLDDQAETVLMRLLRGSGVTGLAGMAALAQAEGIAIARPLLGLRKAELVAWCEAEGLPYVDDPSNRHPRYTRARLRALIAEEGLDAEALARLARRTARAEEALTAMTDAAEARLGLVAEGGAAATAFAAEPREIQIRLIARALGRAGGRDPRRLGLEKLEALAEALAQAQAKGEPFGANVGGAQVTLTPKGRIDFGPEAPRGK